LAHSGQFDEVLAERRAILSASQRFLGPDHAQSAAREGDVASALAELSRFPEAEATFRAALDRLGRSGGARSPQGVVLETSFAEVLDTVGKPDEARPHFEAALAGGRAVLGPRHPQVAQVLIKYGFFLTQRRDDQGSRAALEEAVSILEPLGHYDVGSALRYLGFAHLAYERLPEAHQAFARAEEFLRGKLGPEHPSTLAAVVTRAYAQARLGRPQAAEPALREAIAVLVRIHGERSNEVRSPRKYLGEVLRMAGRPVEAEALHRDAMALERELFAGRDTIATASTRHQLALDLLAAGGPVRLVEARRLTDEAIVFLRAHDLEPLRLGDYLITSGRIAAAQGDAARARREIEEAVRYITPRRGPRAPSILLARQTLQALPVRSSR
jgi:tetratricopeptide (TPR) repeat protein